MSDLISRQDAIDALERIFNRCEEIETHLPDGDPDKTGYKMFPDYMIVWKYLRQLPSAQQWIPCSERLPEEDEYVLATTVWGYITMAENLGDDMWFIHEGDSNAYTKDILAWMPLPQPWKGEENES